MKLDKFNLIISLLFCINIYSQKEYVFFGSYNWDKTTDGIYVYQLDNINGKLTKLTTVKDVLNPSYLTISPNGKYIYACTESKTPNAGSVSAYKFDSEKTALTLINSQKSGGENPVYLNVHENGKWLVNANYTDGSVSVYPILENGAIDSIAQNIKFIGESINSNRQEKTHIHSAVFSPKFDCVFLADLGADKIRVYPFDNSKKPPLNLEKSSFINTELGSGPRHFTFSPNGQFAYCIEEISGTICAFSYAENELKKIQRIETHSKNQKEGFESSDIHISPDGKFLYASNRGYENNIAIYSIAPNGFLKLIGYQSTLGKHPRTFAINQTGKFIFVTNVISQNVVVFSRNLKTGLLKKVGKPVKIKNVSCVKTRIY